MHGANLGAMSAAEGNKCQGSAPVLLRLLTGFLAAAGTCHGADYSWRVDTQPSYDFILPFLSM